MLFRSASSAPIAAEAAELAADAPPPAKKARVAEQDASASDAATSIITGSEPPAPAPAFAPAPLVQAASAPTAVAASVAATPAVTTDASFPTEPEMSVLVVSGGTGGAGEAVEQDAGAAQHNTAMVVGDELVVGTGTVAITPAATAATVLMDAEPVLSALPERRRRSTSSASRATAAHTPSPEKKKRGPKKKAQ